ncbi:hypothetical protein [uncultured Fibrella sp.]|uniref:hypothetical protein n=1 Tax=uncultured Fibrella sp. TaxID=1284596 RepID=UPI0035CAFFD4
MTVPLAHILVFKTSLQTLPDCVKATLDAQAEIQTWTIDLQDVDCVLRVISATLTPATIIHLISRHGYDCAELD